MRTVWLTLLFVLLLPAQIARAYPTNSLGWSPPQIDSLKIVANRAIDLRIKAMEKRWDIHYDPALRPQLSIDDPATQRFLIVTLSIGMYQSEFQLITLLLPQPGEKDWPKVSTLDHELVHVYADQRSRALGRPPWPNATAIVKSGLDVQKALRLQNEGLATSATDPRDTAPGSKWRKYLPTKPTDCTSGTIIGQQFTYGGGRAMIQDLLDHVGFDRTVVYVITHPVDLKGRSFYDALVHWVEQAHADLHIKLPKHNQE